jgi:hypothetical protein
MQSVAVRNDYIGMIHNHTPNEPSLASTHPHHKHVPPNIKRNRIPAPGLSFVQPNLPFLIEEIETNLLPKQS